MRVLAVVEKEKLKWEQRGQEYAGKGEGMQEIEVDMEADPTVQKGVVETWVEGLASGGQMEGTEERKGGWRMVVGMEWVEMEVEVMAKEEAWGRRGAVMEMEVEDWEVDMAVGRVAPTRKPQRSQEQYEVPQISVLTALQEIEEGPAVVLTETFLMPAAKVARMHVVLGLP
ncbi:hypothetical protein CYMTET_3118 [Cymbomonas tetramitiformis]|uniref:Uncharacterized protein n=1 Tax=Cymbomonas tetramitiformis TaxID=36881 RepID=A0AAE0H3Y4_9CHLO|nr:hypothetical protein CYMTET_3118 [Cymbomonas tetramitiformis]